MRIVVDTNVLVSAISPGSPFFKIIYSIAKGNLKLLISTEIYFEYIEIIANRSRPENVEYFETFILENDNIVVIEPEFKWELIQSDKDDNKFVDCSISGNADFLITSDKYFNILNMIPFPKVAIISPDEFLKLIDHV